MSREPRPCARRPLSLIALFACLCAATFARASVYEGFEYAAGTPVGGLTGGTGFRSSRWGESNGVAVVRPGSLTDPTGTLLTTGNHIEGTSAYFPSRQISDRPGADGGEWWVSFLMRRTGPPTGWIYSGLRLQTDGTPGTFFIGGNRINPENDSAFTIGRLDAPPLSTEPFESGRDYFVVARFQVGEGNDAATLWVNPPPGTTVPAGGITYTGGDFGLNYPVLGFDAFVMPGTVTSFDELRAGTSYAEVAPVVPEPAGLAVGALLMLGAFRHTRKA